LCLKNYVSLVQCVIMGYVGLGAAKLQLDLLLINQCILEFVIFKEEQRFSLNKVSERNL